MVVLQTGAQPIGVPYFADGALVHLNPRTPTRHIVAGLATALGGVGAPFQRFDVIKRRNVNHFLWANGSDARSGGSLCGVRIWGGGGEAR